MGYGESKWIAERILDAAAKATPLQPTILRIGQISGGKNGSWNTSDWLPAVIKSSLTLGSLPEFKGVSDCLRAYNLDFNYFTQASSWIPLDLAAETVVDLRNEGVLAVNLVHPQPVACKQLFDIFSQELSLPFIPYAEWVAKLEKAAAETSQLNNSSRIAEFADKVPAATLLEFFQGALKAEEFVGDDSEALGFPRLVTENARKASGSFRGAGKLGAEDVRSWLTYWREAGFLV
jgi:thioester reductase-like protein